MFSAVRRQDPVNSFFSSLNLNTTLYILGIILINNNKKNYDVYLGIVSTKINHRNYLIKEKH